MSTSIRKAWKGYQRLKGPARELATLGLALAVGILVLPFVIWAAGQVFLGDYVRDPSGLPTGGPFALWVDFLKGLAAGSMGYWIAALGPYLLLLGVRGARGFLRR